MKIKVNHDEVRSLMIELNRKLVMLRTLRRVKDRREILDELLEGEFSELKQLASIFKVSI